MYDTALRLHPQFFAEDTTPMGETGEETDDGSDLFDADGFEDTTPDEPEGQAPAEAPEETAPPAQPPAEMMAIKHNHREIQVPKAALEATAAALGIPMEAAAATLQKGLNYDSALERARQSAPELAILDRYARANGMERIQYVQALERQYQESQLQREAQQIQAQYPGASPELARQVAQGNLLRQQEQQRRTMEERQEKEQRQKEAPWEEFFTQNPGMTAEDIPQEVFDRVAKGLSPLAAWYERQNEDLRRQMAAKEQNQKNKQGALTSARDGAAPGGKDPFLDGFDSVWD